VPSTVTYQTPRLGRYQGFGNLIANAPIRSDGNNRVDRKVRTTRRAVGTARERLAVTLSVTSGILST